ncbi:MAG: hypothetical protein Q9221_006361 [Calogaya cf. arnoldii]
MPKIQPLGYLWKLSATFVTRSPKLKAAPEKVAASKATAINMSQTESKPKKMQASETYQKVTHPEFLSISPPSIQLGLFFSTNKTKMSAIKSFCTFGTMKVKGIGCLYRYKAVLGRVILKFKLISAPKSSITNNFALVYSFVHWSTSKTSGLALPSPTLLPLKSPTTSIATSTTRQDLTPRVTKEAGVLGQGSGLSSKEEPTGIKLGTLQNRLGKNMGRMAKLLIVLALYEDPYTAIMLFTHGGKGLILDKKNSVAHQSSAAFTRLPTDPESTKDYTGTPSILTVRYLVTASTDLNR